MNNFEGRVVRRDGYYDLRDVSHAATDFIIEGCVARCNGCMDRFVPQGSRIERQRVGQDLRKKSTDVRLECGDKFFCDFKFGNWYSWISLNKVYGKVDGEAITDKQRYVVP
uniref:Uncharacterized protein n=1 Tax=Solanum tuberosum TaxID=4113 RepID=M1DV94_SOLTU